MQENENDTELALSVLILDTDVERREKLRVILEFFEYQPVVAQEPRQWQREFEEQGPFDLAFVGPCSEDDALFEAFREIKDRSGDVPIVAMIRGDPDREDNPELNAGVVAKVSVPLRQQELQHALQQVRLYREGRHLEGGPRSLELFRNLVGSSAGIRHVRQLIEQVADTDANVLLLGESGTGKEVVARNIHYHSRRRYKPFVPVNCGAIPAELLESELFGHEKGAFTGAVTTRRGRFEMAGSGTLFLDEIGDMPLARQVKLLRVLQERTFERVGSSKSIGTDARIVAATHTNLEEAIAAGKFREDLYYRLNVFPIDVPALRERIEDLPLLINDLISRIEHEKRGSIRLTPAALKSLCQYHWPGNVRELANLIERLVILYPYGVVDVQDLPDKYRAGPDGEPREDEVDLSGVVVAAQTLPREGIDLKEHLNNMEYTLIKQALDEAEGVVAHAAKRLRMGRTTLVEKMRKYGLQRRDEVSNA
jgi:sigma-54 specific flagellar transcriptional regulator A